MRKDVSTHCVRGEQVSGGASPVALRHVADPPSDPLPFRQAYIPTVFENYVTQVTFESKLIELALWDTAGQERFHSLAVRF